MVSEKLARFFRGTQVVSTPYGTDSDKPRAIANVAKSLAAAGVGVTVVYAALNGVAEGRRLVDEYGAEQSVQQEAKPIAATLEYDSLEAETAWMKDVVLESASSNLCSVIRLEPRIYGDQEYEVAVLLVDDCDIVQKHRDNDKALNSGYTSLSNEIRTMYLAEFIDGDKLAAVNKARQMLKDADRIFVSTEFDHAFDMMEELNAQLRSNLQEKRGMRL